MSAPFPYEWLGYPGVTLLGVLVGACELIPRYKDAPFRVLRLPALVEILRRALVSRCLSLMQSVTDEEQEQLADLIALLDGDAQLDSAARIDGLPCGLLDLAGADLLRTAVRMTIEPDAARPAMPAT